MPYLLIYYFSPVTSPYHGRILVFQINSQDSSHNVENTKATETQESSIIIDTVSQSLTGRHFLLFLLILTNSIILLSKLRKTC